MHTIRSRRFSSVHFWHLVVLFVLVCGQLSTGVVVAQTTPSPAPDAFLSSDECLMPSASPTDQLTHNQLWLSSLSTPRLYEFEAQSTLVTCSSEEQDTAVKKSQSDAKTSVAKQLSSSEPTLAQMPSSVQVPNSIQMPTPVPLPALVPIATPAPQILVLTASPSATTAQILAPARPARPKLKKATPSPTPLAKPATSSVTLPADAPTVAKPTSEPVNTPVPAPTAPTDLESLFQQHAATHGVNPSIMKKIAQCESGMRPEAANGPYGGMFQFNSSTWVSNRKAMGKDPNPSLRYNAAEAIETAAFKMGRDGYGAWPSCSRKALASI